MQILKVVFNDLFIFRTNGMPYLPGKSSVPSPTMHTRRR